MQFYRCHHPQRPRLGDPEVQRWLFAGQPGSDKELPLFILESGSEVVGSAGYVGARLSAGDLSGDLVFPVNYFVRDDFKGLPALRLFKAVMSENRTLVGAYVSGDARRLLGKLGFVDRSTDMKAYHYGVRAKGLGREGVVHLFRRAAEAGRALRRAVFFRHAVHRVSTNLEDSFVRDLQAIPGTIHIEKTVEYMRWRYASSPTLNCHYIYQAVKSTPGGLVVTHHDSSRKELVILDVLCSRRDAMQLTSLVDATIRFARELGCSSVVTHALSARLDKVLRRCLFGFRTSDLGIYVFSTIKPVHEMVAKSPDLHLVLGDTDAY